tara:strand:- start:91 stop:408 length:318 start_codon:yes stop_codon:yes gene_type:complete
MSESTPESRQAIIDAIDVWADENEYTVMAMGTYEGRAEYADAIIGTTDKPFPAIVYLVSGIVDVFMKQGMDHEEAWEFYGYNTARSLDYIDPKDGPPILVDDVRI